MIKRVVLALTRQRQIWSVKSVFMLPSKWLTTPFFIKILVFNRETIAVPYLISSFNSPLIYFTRLGDFSHRNRCLITAHKQRKKSEMDRQHTASIRHTFTLEINIIIRETAASRLSESQCPQLFLWTVTKQTTAFECMINLFR